MSDNSLERQTSDALILWPEYLFTAQTTPDSIVNPDYLLLDVPVIVRVLRQLQDAGVARSTVILPESYRKLDDLVRKDLRIGHDVAFHFIGEGEIASKTAKAALAKTEGPVLIVRSDLIAPAALLEKLALQGPESGMRLLIEPPSQKADCMALRREDRNFRMSPEEVEVQTLAGALWLSNDARSRVAASDEDLPTLISLEAAQHPLESTTASPHWSQPVRVDSDIPLAETYLLNALRKPIDGIIAKTINRHISIPISRRLVRTFVTPNIASFFTLIAAIIAAWFVAQGSHLSMLAGAALFQFASIVDGVDGELARLRYHFTKYGEWVDTVIDDISNFLFFASLTYAVAVTGAGPAWLVMFGAVTLGSYACITPLMYSYIIMYTDSGDVMAIDYDFNKTDSAQSESLPVRILSKLKYATKRDFFIFTILCFALIGKLPYMLAVSGSVSPLILIAILNQHRQKRASLKRG